MENTGRFDLPLIMPSQAQKHVTHNEALTLVDGLLHLVIKSFGETSPPVDAQIDDAFVVGASPTGAWFGQAGNLAFNTDAGWRFAAPRQGVTGLNAAAARLVIFDQGIWKPVSETLDIAALPLLGINASADTTNRLAVRSNAALLTAVNAGDGGNGDMQMKLNKEAAADTGSLLYQTGFSGRAEIGLAGDDDLSVKVSPDGAAWVEALRIDRTSGAVALHANSVANSALASMAAGRIKGRAAAGTGTPEDLTGTQATALLDVFAASAKGLAPASGGGAVNFLRADGTWAAPSGGGSSAWGGITGTLSAQADLQTALNGKQASGSYAAAVHTHPQADVTGLAAAMAGKEPAITAGTAAQYLRGDKSLGTLDKTAVGLASVDNTSDVNKPVSAAAQTALNAKLDASAVSAFGLTLVDDADATAARTTLGLGTLALQSGTFTGASSGTNTGDQTISLTGNVTGSGTGSFATVIAAGAVSNAMLANVATATFKGRATAATGAPEDLTATQATALLNPFTALLKGLAPASGGGTANFLRADGAWAAPAGGTAEPNSNAGRFYAFHDCLSAVSTPDWTFTVSGTGAAHSQIDFADANSIGALRLALGTVATNRGSIASPVFTAFQLGQGIAKWASRIRLNALSNTTDTWSLRSGFIDSITAESADGAFFRYTDGVNGGKFQAVTRSNSVETAVDTLVTAAINTTYKLEVEVNAAGTSVGFRINGALAATITTNIPAISGRETGYGLFVLRTLGTAAVNSYDVDYVMADLAFSTVR